MLNFNKKLTDISDTEKVLLLNFKNGSNKEFLISNIVKIHLEINKRNKLILAFFCFVPSFFVFVLTDDYFLPLIILLSVNLFFFNLNKFTSHKFKFKLVVKDSDLEIHSFGFDYQLKNKIIDSISRIKKSSNEKIK